MNLVTTINSTNHNQLDLAGYCHITPNYLQTRARINYLLERYLSLAILTERLLDLPQQFKNPQQRHWQKINWQAINSSQIIGIPPKLFLQVIISAVEIEAPIRSYSQESWNYLQKAHPQLARFMGGVTDENGRIIEVGIWEKEERQHAPAFRKIYQQLTGEKLEPKPNTVHGYQPTGNLRTEIYNHGVSRISSEWSAVSIYLWLMSHSTGALQMAIAQPLQDEVNHLAKFWGITRWGFGDSVLQRVIGSISCLIKLLNHHQEERTAGQNIMDFSYLKYGLEIGYTFTKVMAQMCRWNYHLKPDALNQVFGSYLT
ncbi:MAG: hypothetical protein QNJ68_23835 [Microcoleaceae cyanobacterium MO_207.B10]|nr:hypothetical protein [Microcoleaceae cyanobacterium MO_207.B10]